MARLGWTFVRTFPWHRRIERRLRLTNWYQTRGCPRMLTHEDKGHEVCQREEQVGDD